MIGGFVAAAAAMVLIEGAYSAPQHMSDAGRDMLLKYEGFAAEAVEEKPGFWTIGYGMDVTMYKNGYERFVVRHERVTKQEAAEVFAAKLGLFEDAVCSFAKTHSLYLTQNQFDALVDYSYNRGFSKLKNDFNAGKWDSLGWALAMKLGDSAVKEIWLQDGVTYKGQFHQGLYQRRLEEWTLYSKDKN